MALPEAPINALVQLPYGTQALLRHVHLAPNDRLTIAYDIMVPGRDSRRQVRRAMTRVATCAMRLDLAQQHPTKARRLRAQRDAKWLSRHLLAVAKPAADAREAAQG